MDFYNEYFEGIFWIPGKKSNKITATLFIDNQGNCTITSLQSLKLDKGKNIIDRDWKKIDIVVGYISSNKTSKNLSIKLHNVQKTHQSENALSKYKYISHECYLSTRIDNEIESLNYNIVMISAQIINDWINISGFELDFNDSESIKVNQFYKQPEIIDLFKNDSLHIYIYFRASVGYPMKRKSKIEETVFINIQTSSDKTIQELNNLKVIIERLLNVLLLYPFTSSQTEFKSESGNSYLTLKKPKEFSTGISQKINYETFISNSQIIFDNWLQKQDQLKLSINNFFSVYGQKGVLVENRFLTYISILENYHKNRVSNKDVILKERLKFILKNSIINSKIKSIDDYAQKLKTTRNYHSHLEEKHEAQSLNTDNIMKANVLLEFIIREIFIKEAGVTDVIMIPSFLEDSYD